MICFQPFKLILYTFKWLVMELIIQWSKIRMIAEGASYDMIYDDELGSDYNGGGTRTQTGKISISDEDDSEHVTVKETETVYRACDKKANLYILQQSLFIHGGSTLSSYGKSKCSR